MSSISNVVTAALHRNTATAINRAADAINALPAEERAMVIKQLKAARPPRLLHPAAVRHFTKHACHPFRGGGCSAK